LKEGDIMERRQFLTTSAFSALSIPALATLFQSSPAAASHAHKMVIDIIGEQLGDLEESYASWANLTPGGQIKHKVLWASDTGAICRLIRFQKGVTVPRHLHPEGELTCIVAGNVLQNRDQNNGDGQIVSDRYLKGDIIWMPPESIHGAANTDKMGATVLSLTPQNIRYM
jgi:quercetin dioxygenase-like cupin family protein